MSILIFLYFFRMLDASMLKDKIESCSEKKAMYHFLELRTTANFHEWLNNTRLHLIQKRIIKSNKNLNVLLLKMFCQLSVKNKLYLKTKSKNNTEKKTLDHCSGLSFSSPLFMYSSFYTTKVTFRARIMICCTFDVHCTMMNHDLKLYVLP